MKNEHKLNNLDDAISMELAKNPTIASHNLCMQEEEVIKDTLNRAFEARIKLHKLGIVHPKYLDFVCITTIYEYFETGRCNALVGTNGAYNLYENEVRMNLIINKLDIVIDQLYQIQKNQYMLYNELKTANEHLSEISQATNKALNKLDQIAYNTAQTAYYSKINAKLTDALGYLIALK